MIIRDPVVVTASLPKFLTPGDKASLRLDIANTDAPAGEYQVQVTGNPAVEVEQPGASQAINLTAGGKFDLTLPLVGVHPGDGVVSVKLSNTAGMSLEQTLNLPVRPATLPMTVRKPIKLAPNASVKVDSELLAGSILQGASVSLNVTRSTALRHSCSADDA